MKLDYIHKLYRIRNLSKIAMDGTLPYGIHRYNNSLNFQKVNQEGILFE